MTAREDERRDRLRLREEEALQELLEGLNHLQQNVALRAVQLPLITDPEIRARYRALVSLADELGKLGSGTGERDRQRGDVVRYIGYVRHSVKAALQGEPPCHLTPIPLSSTRTDDARWTPPVTDPEDTYFPDERS